MDSPNLRTDGRDAMSRDFSGGKQVTKFSNPRNRGGVSRQHKIKKFLSLRRSQQIIVQLEEIIVTFFWTQ